MAIVKGLDAVIRNITKLLDDEAKSKKTLMEISDFVIGRIQGFARSGFSLVGGKKKKFKKLSKSYIAMRQGAVKFRTLPNGVVVGFQEPDERLKEVDSEFFTPDLSQVTFTGQMLRAIKGVISGNKLTISVDSSRRSGKYETLDNAQVAKHVADNGRAFMGLDKLGFARVKSIILDNFRKSKRKKGL